MAVFPHGINVKIVSHENAEWLVTLENQKSECQAMKNTKYLYDLFSNAAMV